MEWRKVTKFSQAMAILLGIVIFVLGIWIGMQIGPSESNSSQDSLSHHLTGKVPAANSPEATTTKTTGADGAECYQNAQYFVVSKPHGDFPGNDILIKSKRTGENVSCEYVKESGDFEISHSDEADSVLALTGHFLILDSGTAPDPRGLSVYDLQNDQKTYTGKYSKPVQVSSGSLTFWEPTDAEPTEENCPDLKQYQTNGLGAEIEKQVSLSLNTLAKDDLGPERCQAVQ
ncbi:MAG TPA: hypothetical protein VFM02_03585 [Candidatus Paceibacterota bacterium]|nr:hypothetical protein [Candidatus Paceibacterota bacterium]